MFPCLHLYKAASSVLPLVLAPPIPQLLLAGGSSAICPPSSRGSISDWCWEHREGERLRDFHLHPSYTSQSRYLSFSLGPPSQPTTSTVTHSTGTLMHPSLGPVTVSCSPLSLLPLYCHQTLPPPFLSLYITLVKQLFSWTVMIILHILSP